MRLHDARAKTELEEGLTRALPEIPSKYFYDDVGSALFEEITELPEYYPTRTEQAILDGQIGAILDAAPCRELVELGSGAGRKIRTVLDALRARNGLERCVLFEINQSFLDDSVATLEVAYPGLDVQGIQGDFEYDLERLGPGGGRLILFLAGTIGNLDPEEAEGFLRAARRRLVAGPQPAAGDALLIGFDLVKDPQRLVDAYDDAAGVTAAFNRNILRVVNQRFGADFEPEAFEHVALWDAENAWIEMRLRATRPMDVQIPAVDVSLSFDPGDEIRTEISTKYTRPRVEALAEAAGMRVDGWFTDPEALFALALLRIDR